MANNETFENPQLPLHDILHFFEQHEISVNENDIKRPDVSFASKHLVFFKIKATSTTPSCNGLYILDKR